MAAQVPRRCARAGRAENYIKTLDHGGYFEVTALSKEDLKKTELYHQNAERAKHRRRCRLRPVSRQP